MRNKFYPSNTLKQLFNFNGLVQGDVVIIYHKYIKANMLCMVTSIADWDHSLPSGWNPYIQKLDVKMIGYNNEAFSLLSTHILEDGGWKLYENELSRMGKETNTRF